MIEDEGEFVKLKDKKSKRRSSFFQRRLSSYSFDSPKNTDTRKMIAVNQYDCNRTQEDMILEYMSELNKEKEDWKQLLRRLKKEESALKEKCPQAVTSCNFLTPEDKKFLKERPDYVGIGRLVDRVTEAVAIKQRRITATTNKALTVITDCDQLTQQLIAQLIENIMDGFYEFNRLD